MTRVLLLTDFSENALHAAKYAVKLFGTTDAAYVLVHAHYDASISGPMDTPYAAEIVNAQKESLELAAQKLVKASGARNVENELLHGPITVAVLDLLEGTEFDVIVTGKRGGSGSLLFGSNTTDMIKRSPIPVLAVPEKAELNNVQRILLADDHDEVLPESLALLRSIAVRHNAQVLVAHMAAITTEDPSHWSNGLYDLALKGVPHSFIEAHGRDVVEGIERAAKNRSADMITVLHRHTGFLERLFSPSVAKELALESELPLLVLEQKT